MKQTELPIYFEKLFEEKFDNVKISLNTLANKVSGLDTSIQTLVEKSDKNRRNILFLTGGLTITFLLLIAHLLGVPLPISKFISL